MPAPSGVVTFLFTDIEGSTRRWEADADAMCAALAVHDKVLRSAIEAHDGFLFSHSGDGAAAAFASPISAVQAAIDAQHELQLPVRMGIATGEAELRDSDYFGTVLNRAARLMAAGHGGQVLIADSTAALLDGVDLLTLGSRLLPDVPLPITLYQLQAPGLKTEFPPLRTRDPTPGNLRRTASIFVGRETEVTEVSSAIRSHRLVTLTGVGGVGKTRLAVEIATQLADEFADGVWVFELAAVSDPAAAPDAVAAILGVTQQPGMSMAESVATALAGRRRLLVFDNCEHLLEATADLIEAILAASTTVRILATSREGLGVSDEQAWPLRSLDLGSSAELFVERARNVAPGFSPNDDDAVVDICRRLDGIPLAIELAASRMASMTASEVRDRLSHRFKLLVGSRRAIERHQTLRHAVAWSYDLLDDAEKSLLKRCSVFAGGFDLEAACAIAAPRGTDEFEVLDTLDALVRKSLLIVDRAGGRTRYSMLETIRQFADSQLAASGAAEDARAAYARYFAGLQADVLTQWDSPQQQKAYAWFSVELANLRTAFRWAAEHRDLDVAATIATDAAVLGFCVENYEPVAWAEELIESARAVDHPRLVFLYAMATQCWFVGRVDEALRYTKAGETAIAAGRRGELPFGFEGILANPYIAIGKPDRSIKWCRDLIARTPDVHVNTRAFLVMALTIAGRDDDAMAAATGLIEAAEATGNPFAHSMALMAHGFAYRSADPDQAVEVMRQGLIIAHDSGNRFNESHIAANLAQLEVERGDPMAALDHIGLAIRRMYDSGNRVTVRSPFANLAILLDRLGIYEPAATIAGFAFSPLTVASFPKITEAISHLREVLDHDTFESLTRQGRTMTTTGVVAYAYDQIDQTRVLLEQGR